jgi:hypothetical protein
MKRFLALLLLLYSNLSFAAPLFQADGELSVTSTLIANNTTAIVISNRPAALYFVDAYNNGTTLAFIKLYNACGTATSATCLQAATCGQTTPAPVDRMMIPFGTSASGGGFALPNINGDAYGFGIVMCVTTGIADNDTNAPAASTYIVNVHYKPQR